MFPTLEKMSTILPTQSLQRLLLEGSSLLDSEPTTLLKLADAVLAEEHAKGDDAAEIQACYWRALALRQIGDCDAAIDTLHRAHALARYRDDTESLVLILLGYARISTATGLYDAALQFLFRAAALGEEVLPGEHPTLLDIQRSYCIIKSQLGHHVLAVQEYLDLTDRYLTLGLVRDAVYCLNNAGNNCSRMLDFQQAIACYDRAEHLLRRNGEWPLLLAVLRANRATPLAAIGQEHAAVEALLQTLPTLVMLGHRSAEIDARTKLGKLFIQQGMEDDGEYLLEKALALAAESGLTPKRVDVHDILAAFYKQKEDYKNALAHTELAMQLRAEITSAEAAERLDRGDALVQLEAALEAIDAERSKRLEIEETNTQLRKMTDVLAEASRAQNRLVESLRREAQSDPLTGIANRRRLDERLTEEHQRASRYRRPVSMLFVDLDHFKRINDRFTHLVGDSVLRATAAMLIEQIRQCDVVGRFGGEEFVIALPETSLQSAMLVAEKLRSVIASYEWSAIRQNLTATVSIGVAQLAVDESLADWLTRTDLALYAAKNNGRNRIAVG